MAADTAPLASLSLTHVYYVSGLHCTCICSHGPAMLPPAPAQHGRQPRPSKKERAEPKPPHLEYTYVLTFANDKT